MYETWDLVAALVIVFGAAVLQGSIGFGLSLASVPLLTLLDPGFVPVPLQIIAVPVALSALVRERGRVDLAGVGWVMAGRVPGSIVAAIVLGFVVERTLDLLIGSVVLVAVVILASGITLPLTRVTRLVVGVVSGFSGTASAIGGPPVALLYRNEAGPTVRSTLGTILGFGMIINLVVLTAAGLVDRHDVVTALMLAPAAAAGFLASSRVKHRADGEVLRNAILVVASVAAVGLLVRAALP